jgi:hypothetical protein
MPRCPRTRPALRRRMTLIALVAGAIALASAVLPVALAPAPIAVGDALAGGYTIYVCDTSPPDGVPASNDSFVRAFPERFPLAFSTRGMLGTRAGRRCSPGRGVRGLVTMNYYRRGGTVPKGTRARYSVTAPGGTRISRLRWAGSTYRRDCRWALQIYTLGPGAGNAAIANKRAGQNCPRRRRAQASGLRGLRAIPQAAGATTFVQRVVCQGGRRSRRCSNRAPAYVRTTALEVSIADASRPGIGLLRNTPMAQGRWVRADQPLNYNAADNTGVQTVQAIVSGSRRATHERDCDYRGIGGLIPCPNGAGTITIPADRLPEGTQPLGLTAIDSANNSRTVAAGSVRIDHTPPGAVPIEVTGGEGWRNTNSFTLGWANPAEGDRAPITAAHYRLCPAGRGTCQTSSRGGLGIARIAGLGVPAPGEWRLQVWREDAAGNQLAANASQAVALRYDPEVPTLGFEAPSAEDPTKLAAQVTDKVSGLGSGQIEISRRGSGTWQQLPTAVQGSRLVARVDDARLPAGIYQVRGFARDKAANQAVSDRRLDGRPMVIALPLRIRTNLRAGIAKRRTVTRRVRRHGERRRVRRRITVLRKRSRVRFGRHATIAGRLTNSDGQPLSAAEIRVYSRSETSGEQLVKVVRTARDGRYSYRARASASRTLRLVYGGSARILPAQSEVRLLVPAASTIGARPRRTANKRRVRFRGRLRAPQAGKLVELQALVGPEQWQTFRTLRTDARGVWRTSYRFTSTCRSRRFRFRALLPKQQATPTRPDAPGRSPCGSEAADAERHRDPQRHSVLTRHDPSRHEENRCLDAYDHTSPTQT